MRLTVRLTHGKEERDRQTYRQRVRLTVRLTHGKEERDRQTYEKMEMRERKSARHIIVGYHPEKQRERMRGRGEGEGEYTTQVIQ